MDTLEAAIISILRESADTGACAITHTDIHVQLVRRQWKVQDIMPARIMEALIALEALGLARNELCWHAVPQAPAKDATKHPDG